MSKWIHTTLNDICRSDKGAIISGPFGSNISSKFFVLDGVPVIRGNNLSLSLDTFFIHVSCPFWMKSWFSLNSYYIPAIHVVF